MPTDEYDILPRNSIERLKADLDNLKAKTNEMSSDSSTKEVIGSINELKTSINNLMSLFTTAAEEMKMEEAENVGVEKKLGPLSRKLDTLIEQNQEIARGLVVIADMIKEHFPKIEQEIDDWGKKKSKWQEEREEEPKFIDIPTKKFKTDMPQSQPMVSQQQTSNAQSMQSQQPFQQQNQQQFGSLGSMPDFAQAPQAQPMTGFGQPNQLSFNFGNDLPPLSAPEPFPSLNETQPKKKGLFDKLLGK